MYRLALVATSVLAILGTGHAHAGDPVAGQEKSQACIACHGETGIGDTKAYPILAGQHESYLYYTLKTYQSGERHDPIMAAQVRELSDQDLRDLAAFYARQEGGVFTPRLGRSARID